VHNRNTGEYYAAKSLQVLSGRDRKKILREIGCLELCVQENLIALVEAYEVEADPYSLVIVMKPWASYSLWNFLSNPDASRRAVLPWFKPSHANSNQQVYRIMSGIVAAVQFLHQRSIKHKDIKPQNILLHLEDGRVRPIVTDVGESKVYRHGGSTDPMKSSYEYLAPEQQLATDEVQSTLKADIWQLGCCFAMLLVVARRGTAGLYQLWHSFHNTDENCSCNIANQSGPFLSKLEEICTPSSALEEHAYQIVLQMLERDPHARLDIMAVRQTLDFLLV
jgi:serine/threonine protein kinase